MSHSPFPFLPPWLDEFRSVAVALVGRDGQIIEANQGFRTLMADLPAGSAAERFIEPRFSQLLGAGPDAKGEVYHGLITLGASPGIRRTFSGKVYHSGEMLFVAAEVDIAAFEKLQGEADRLGQELDAVKQQLTRRNQALKKALDDLKERRGLDGLTGLPLRRRLDERMDQEILRWERYRRPLALVILDIDDFAAVNGDYGRETGDDILVHVATILKQSVRSLDFTVRYGGQEFAVMLPETNEMGALIVAERLRMELESQIILPLVRPLTASFGVAMLMSGETRDELCRRAERAVEHSKANGKDCVTMAGVIGECDHIYRGMKEAL